MSDRTTGREWRVRYKHEQFGGIAAGEITLSCRNRNHALEVYAHHMALAHVTSARIEYRPFTDWGMFDIEKEAEDTP